jgi:hypothetical protein
MRAATSVLIVLVMTACTTPPPKQLTDAQPVPADWTSEELLAAQRAGYSLVTRDGQQVMCRRDPQTGSRLQHNTICMTAKEWQRTRSTSRDTVQDLTRGQQPSCALEKNC